MWSAPTLQYWATPPSANSSIPLTYALSSDARNTATFAHVVRRTKAAQRNMGHRLRLFLVAHQLREAGGVDMLGTEHIDANIAPLEIQDPAAGKRVDCRLGGVVHGE